ncbi:MAG: MFS transporter, partial [Nitrospirota bacterium]|nr:MFS transporter [Nitrospirota bacterium]
MIWSRSFVLLCGVGIFCFISYNLVRMPVLALFAQSLGAGPEAIGLVVSVSTLTGVFLKLPSGALSDIYGRRLLLRVGVVAFGLPPFIYPFIHDVNALIALRFVHGLATAIFAPSALATVADLYRERRGAAMGTYTACTQAGALLGPVLGGWLIYAAGFPMTFVTAGVFGCLGVMLFALLHLNPPPPRVKEK